MKIHITKEHLFLITVFFLHLSGPIERIYIHNEMSIVINSDLITPLGYYSLTMVSPLF